MTDDSYLVSNDQGQITSYVGKDATHLFRARTVRLGLVGWLRFKMKPTRGINVTKMLAVAGEYTGKKYKRTQVAEAIADLDVWINTMVAALPVEKM